MMPFANRRKRHPYYMYDMIHSQPEFVAETLRRLEGVEPRRLLGQPRRLLVTGCGTSFHAAQYGAAVLQRALGPSNSVEAAHAYDLAFGEPPTRGAVVLGVSHSGSTPMTNRALRRARRLGRRTLGLCGVADSDMEEETAGTWVVGSARDRSWANTMSYTSQLCAFAVLAERIRPRAFPGLDRRLEGLSKALRATLACESRVRLLSTRVARSHRVTFLASGLDEITALEGALKIRETCGLSASGYHVEQFVHGPFLSVDALESIVLLRSKDDAPRSSEIGQALHVAGAKVTSIGDGTPVDIRLPETDRVVRPILSVIPLQFLAYYAALARRTDPDIMRTGIRRLRAGVEALFR